jgi:hypothetical protein
VIAVPAQATDLTTVLGTVGFKGSLGPFALAGSAWYGKNAGPLLGNILQFSPPNNPGDIFGWGAWGQAGYSITNKLSAWFMYGVDHPSYDDITSAYLTAISNSATAATAPTRMRNQNLVAMIRYQDGGFACGAEYMYTRTVDIRTWYPLEGSQISLTANYYF